MSRVLKLETPSQWKKVKLGNICQLRKGNYDPKKGGNLKYIGLEHIDSGDPKLNRFGYEKDVIATQHRFFQDDILYGKLRPYLDKAVLSDFEGICSTDILVIKTIEEEILSTYLINILHTQRFLNYIISTMSGTTLPRTNWKDLSKFILNLPNLSEQKEISNILQNVDNRIIGERKLVLLYKKIKKGLMQDLLTGKKRVKIN